MVPPAFHILKVKVSIIKYLADATNG